MKPERIRMVIAELCGWTDIAWEPCPSGNHLFGYPPKAEVSEGSTITFGETHGVAMTVDRTAKSPIPRYDQDLNAMHLVEQTLFRRDFYCYVNILKDVCSPDGGYFGHEGHEVNAAAIQKAEAFLRWHGKWEE